MTVKKAPARPDYRIELEISAERITGAASLRSWLAGRWAIVFSHPADFTQEQLEMDRWISVLGRSFHERGVTAVALAHADRADEQGWLGRLAVLDPGCTATLALEPAAGPGRLADFATAALRAQIARGGPRFAMIIDSNLRGRRALAYHSTSELPSPLELIGWAVALRKRNRADGERHGAPKPRHRPQPEERAAAHTAPRTHQRGAHVWYGRNS
jgi:hypothetical protein